MVRTRADKAIEPWMSVFAINIVNADVCVRLIDLTGKLRANVRAALFRVVEGIDGSTPLPVSDANLLIDELIRKHPDYNSYKCETR
jgi:hypothetical protein